MLDNKRYYITSVVNKYIEDITWWREDINFMFEWQKRYRFSLIVFNSRPTYTAPWKYVLEGTIQALADQRHTLNKIQNNGNFRYSFRRRSGGGGGGEGEGADAPITPPPCGFGHVKCYF